MNTSQTEKELRKAIKAFVRKSLQDIRVEAAEEFDRNFEREAFFTERWARRKWNDDPTRGMLVRTGSLRRSITLSQTPSFGRVTDNSVVFETSIPYAKIHNEGGDIPVTAKMKKYFMWRYLTIAGSSDGTFSSQFARKKNGDLRNNRKNRQLSDEARFYLAMANKKTGSMIHIPKRQFIGNHRQLEQAIREIVTKNADVYFKT